MQRYGDTIATAGTIAPDHSVTGTIDFAGDQDWYGARLEAGIQYKISLIGSDEANGGLHDPILTLYDEGGRSIAWNDDANNSLNLLLIYADRE